MPRKEAKDMDKEFRTDGYVNVLNKYGTRQDNSTAYRYTGEPHVDDMTLVEMYEGNGLFSTIIDRPAEEAVKHGLDIDFGSEDISKFVENRLDELDFEDKFTTAEKWARLYGGAIIVMLVNDGGGLEDPLNMARATSIEEMMVFERAVVQPDYTTIYTSRLFGSARGRISYGEPEYFQVFSLYGYFRVHRSRCLVFRNGKVPEQTTNTNYRYWGIPEYVKIRNALRECVTSHGYGVKLLEKSSQAVYSVKNLANLLSTDSGEGQVLTRLEAIDMARSMMNTIAIDADGETYEFKTMTMSGAKELIDTTCNMLSAVSQIPQTILFGRSPAGENSTGESDLENYYNMVENIQKQNMKRNCRMLLDIIIKQGLASGEIQEEPEYKVEFAKLWSMNDTEQASLEQQKAQTQYTKAQTAQLYIDAQVIDPSEVRASLEESDDFDLDDISNMQSMAGEFDDDDMNVAAAIDMEEEQRTAKDEGQEQELELAQAIDMESSEITAKDAEQDDSELEIAQAIEINEKDTADQQDDIEAGCGVLIIKNGLILVGDRSDGDGVCGPGGHLRKGEDPADAACREAMEEFGIVPEQILPLGDYKPESSKYEPSQIFLADSYTGEIVSNDGEMKNLRFEEPEKLLGEKLFPPFRESLNVLMEQLGNCDEDEPDKTFDKTKGNVIVTSRQKNENLLLDEDDAEDEEWVCTNPTARNDGGAGSGNFGHSGRPGKIGGSGDKETASEPKSGNGWGENFPKVCVQTNGKTMKSHPDYQAAKHGDYEAAKRMAKDLVKEPRMKQIADAYPDAIIAPICSKGDGHNQIPVAYADMFKGLGMEVEHDIQITSKANRTGESELNRLLSSNEICGNVEKGRKYVIVDDVVTSGASINEYRKYIEGKGGNVVAATTMCMGQAGSNQIAPKKETIEKALEKHGYEKIKEVCSALGAKGLDELTNYEVNYIRSCGKSKIDALVKEKGEKK